MNKSFRKTLFFLAFLVFLGIFIYSSIRLWVYYSAADAAGDTYEALSQLRPTDPDSTTPSIDLSLYETMDPQELADTPDNPYTGVTHPETEDTTYLLPEFEELYALNPDLVGWIRIDGTQVDYPVVQRPTETDYYLYRDFYGKDSQWGCIYVREQCDVFRPSDNVVIYGHRMLDGAMFYDLVNYEKKSFWEEHPTIHFDTLRGRHEYQIICVMKISANADGSYAFHQFTDAGTAEEFDEYWANCLEHALYDTGLDAQWGDKLISLYTCEYSQANGRLVVVAKRITEE